MNEARETQAKIGDSRTCLMPVKVNEEVCFSSPKPVRSCDGGEAALFASPVPSRVSAGSGGKENWQPAQAAVRTPLKTPSRLQPLPTVQEHEGQAGMPPVEEEAGGQASSSMPAWLVRSPEPKGEE